MINDRTQFCLSLYVVFRTDRNIFIRGTTQFMINIVALWSRVQNNSTAQMIPVNASTRTRNTHYLPSLRITEGLNVFTKWC